MAAKAQIFDSRQSMKTKTFEIFHYRDPKPDPVSIHHHDFFEVYFFLSGEGSFLVEGKTYQLQPGDLLLINPQELHQPVMNPQVLYERYVLWIDRGFLQALGEETMDLSRCFDNGQPGHTNLLRPDKVRRGQLQELLGRLSAEFYGDSEGRTLYAKGLLLQLLVEIDRLAQKKTAGAERQEEPDLVSQVLRYISSHYQQNITLEQLSEEFYVSKYYLSHAFSSRIGTSIYRYIIFRRLMGARELMNEGYGPGQVYQLCGFGDYANFYRAFKAEYGISPSEFAASIQKKGGGQRTENG